MAFVPLTLSQLVDAAATAFADQPGVKPPNTDAGSTAGPVFKAAALIALLLQNEVVYTNSILRMGTIPALPNGLPNPDLDSFCAPFGIYRLGAIASSGVVTCSTPAPVMSQVVVPAGAIIVTPQNVQFQILAGGSGYDPATGGYDINSGQSSVNVPVVCLQSGIVGNVAAGTLFTSNGNPQIPSVNSISNASAFTNGENVETDAALKSRFTLTVSSGRVATGNAIIAAALSVETGVIYSFGDRVNLNLTEHDAYFTLIVNLAGSGTVAPTSLINAVIAALEGNPNATPPIPQVRDAGTSYQVLSPTTVAVNAIGTLIPTAQFAGQTAAVQAAATAAYNAYVNGIGLNPDTTPTLCGLFQVGRALLNATIDGVPCIADIPSLTLNGIAGDLSAPFGQQFVAGTAAFVVS